MPTFLLTFLGTGNYHPCQYQMDEITISENTPFFSVALAAFLKPDRVISLQTKQAAEKHGQALAGDLAKHELDHQPVDIPEGKSEAELWQIFDALTQHIPEDCTLHLDITHSLRSLPILGLIALNYLRVTRRVKIGGLHYGAWEARNTGSGIAPAFDLTPFLALLDWTAAADQFFSTGSAKRLAERLTQTHQMIWRNRGGQSDEELPRQLKSLARDLEDTSSSLLFLRTGHLQASTERLAARLQEARSEVAAHASPFLELLNPVKEQLTRFNNTDLDTLRNLVAWLAEREQIAASLTLASEWLTSYVMVKCGVDNHYTNYQARKPYSLAISKLEQPDMDIEEDETGKAALEALSRLQRTLSEADLAALSKIAGTIRSARNDLNHAGFNDHPALACALCQRANEVAQKLCQLP
jgi:CRISPR-associated DxTHG motif protein